MSNYSGNTIHLADELTQKSVTVTTAATELFTGGSRNANRQTVRIYNKGPQEVFIGPSGVTTAAGEPLAKKQWMTLTLGNVAIFARTASATADLIVTELA